MNRRVCAIGCAILAYGVLGLSASALDVKGLALYLPLDEGSGETTRDGGPLKLTGKLVGKPDWVAGKFGKAVAFKGGGSGTWIEIAHDPRLDATDALTVSVWINPNTWDPMAAQCCIQVYGFGVHGGCGGRVQFGMFWEGAMLKLRVEATGGRHDIPATPPLTKQWSHVAATYDGKNALMYINGEKAVEQAAPGGVLKKSNEPFMIATDCERPNYVLNGAVDELVYFQRVLDAGEVKELAARSLQSALAVEANGKTAAMWGYLKSR
jgi:hypothetical protein